MSHIQIRISDEDKQEVRAILENMGLTYSSAIKLFFKKVVQEKKLPFQIAATKEKAVKKVVNVATKVEKSETAPAWNTFTKRKIGS
jgi:addiction module RelB/DinJ family antitoxin